MTPDPRIPLASIEDDVEIVRRCLRKFGRHLQRRGDIAADVSPNEINAELEQHLPGIVRALHERPDYWQIRSKRHIEDFVQSILEARGPQCGFQHHKPLP
jgi:hypothetical protein